MDEAAAVENKNVDSLRDSMRDIIANLSDIREDPDFTKEAIGMHVIANYNWDNIVNRTLAVYKEARGKFSDDDDEEYERIRRERKKKKGKKKHN